MPPNLGNWFNPPAKHLRAYWGHLEVKYLIIIIFIKLLIHNSA